jgi:ankyrin repeat protein
MKTWIAATLLSLSILAGATSDAVTPLLDAAYRDDLKSAEQLIRAGADVKAANRYGVTPLSVACTNGDGAMV